MFLSSTILRAAGIDGTKLTHSGHPIMLSGYKAHEKVKLVSQGIWEQKMMNNNSCTIIFGVFSFRG